MKLATLLFLVSSLFIVGCASLDAQQKQIDDQQAAVDAQDDKVKAIQETSEAITDPVAKAKEIYAARCAACHGTTGKGDGPAAASLDPQPRDYSNAIWKTSVTDSMLSKAIVGGGPAVGKSALMPPSADLADKPTVVAELVKMIRAF